MSQQIPPIERIPPEILSNIFVVACNQPLLLPFDGRQIHWVIGCVCEKWKAISLSEPLLWNDLNMCTEYDVEEDRAELIQGLKEIAPLSNGSLSLYLYYGDHEPDTLTQIILPYLPRVRSLALSIPYFTTAELSSFPPESFMSLEEFTLSPFHRRQSQGESDIFQHLEVFSCMKNLTKLAIHLSSHHSGIDNLVQTKFIPWNQLTELQISQVQDIEGLLCTLRLCGSLVHLMCGPASDLDEISFPSATMDPILPRLKSLTLRRYLYLPLYWERLKTLYISTDTWESLYNVLQRTASLEKLTISLPDSLLTRPTSICRLQSLETLEIVTMPGWMAEYFELPQLSELRQLRGPMSLAGEIQIHDLISRSSCLLRKLVSQTLQYPSIHETSWYTLFASQPTLREIHLPNVTLDEITSNGIAGGSILPALRVLYVKVESLTSFVDMVENCVKMGGMLRDAYGYYYQPVSKDEFLRARDKLAHLNTTIGSSFGLKIPDIYLV
ncbi:hypothetical protein H0H92_000434 [Tricholoma furcatifolium]|nr:hypothetical protein H0H92_000434 [Tricholoma furcatifolium]